MKRRKHRRNTPKAALIKALKYIFRITIGILGTVYLALILLTSLPAFQSWSACVVSDMLAEKTGTRVEIETLRLSLLGRVILDNVRLYDQRDTLMLQSSRIAAKVDLLPLTHKRIRVDNAQLIGTRACIYKDSQEPFNFMFLKEAFSSKDSTSSPLDLSIGALVMRRGDIRFDLLDKPHKDEGLDANHLHLSDISLTARFLAQMPDTIAVDLKNLSFCEQSGLCLKHLSLQLEAGKQGATLSNLLLQMPESSVAIPELKASYNGLEGAFKEPWLTDLAASGNATCSVSPRDVLCLASRLRTFSDVIRLQTQFRMEKGDIRLDGLSIRDNADNLSLLCNALISNVLHAPAYSLDIKRLHTSPTLQLFLTDNLEGQPREVSPILTRLGSTETSGALTYRNKDITADLTTQTEQGSIGIQADLKDMEVLSATLGVHELKVGNLLEMKGEDHATALSFDSHIQGILPGKNRKARLSMDGMLASLIYRGYEHRNLPLRGYLDGDAFGGSLSMDAPAGQVQLQVHSDKNQSARSLQCKAEVKDFAPHNMNLSKRFEGERFSGSLEADFADINIDRLQGSLQLTDLQLDADDGSSLALGNIALTSDHSDDEQHLRVESDFLRADIDGCINWKSLPQTFVQPVRHNLPSLFSTEKPGQASGNDFRFLLEMQDTVVLNRLFAINLRLPQRGTIEGVVSDAVGQIQMEMDIPALEYAGQQLQHITGRAQSSSGAIQTSLQGQRLVKEKPVDLNLDSYLSADKVTSRLRWSNHGEVRNTGDISMTGIIRRDQNNQPAINARLNDSHLVIGDTAWQVEPAMVRYHDKVVDIENLDIHQGDRHLCAGGRISALDTDTLSVQLAGIDVAYILDLVNFHKIDFGGIASGNILATSVMKHPIADAHLQVENFTFNEGRLGLADIRANWGRNENIIEIDADFNDPDAKQHTKILGSINPAKGAEDGLNLNIRTQRIDLAFLRKYTSGIFRDLEGRASGWARVFGPTKDVNLEGDLCIDHLQTHIISLGSDYHLDGDSVIMRPDNIWIRGARLYDHIGLAGMNEHVAIADIHLMHECFRRLRYDINVDAHNILAYNFPSSQNGMSFYGTVYADAQLHMDGSMGQTTIDVTATPMPGTSLVYNVATPGTVTESGFLTYGPLHPDAADETGSQQSATGSQQSADLRINFDIDANPSAQLLLLMDPRSGDNISLYGNGRLRANYYNKGRFQLYGTYRVDHGTYQMSIRDLIRKDFEFLDGGTIVFGGDAMQAALNLKARYTVPNVSLDDLSATGLGLSNTRVDCIMNIGGRAKEPAVTFDFDIPNANEDEKQMVRAMLSSDEERDMQAIYLLGVGRFYSYGTQIEQGQTQGSMAMNSMLSGVISSRFNQIMSQALGGSNWSFGTNLRTGQTGWEQLDVEGLLSGRMLSGRLLFNGNFGYRENKYKENRNTFIGDFDIQYRLSPRSPFSLKAYNQTNDRYFTQSSLTTQGIGIQFQRDFNHWLEIFRRTKKGKKKAQAAPALPPDQREEH